MNVYRRSKICFEIVKVRSKGSITLYSIFVALVILTVGIGFNLFVKEHLKTSFIITQKMEAFQEVYTTYNLLIFSFLTGKFTNREIILFQGEKYLKIKNIPLDGTEVWINGTYSPIPIKISVQDTNGLLSLTIFEVKPFKRLLNFLGIPEEDTKMIVDGILDWIDTDDLMRPNGAEKDYYDRMGLPYKPRNWEMQYKEELLFIRGMRKEFYKKIEPYITILPKTGFNPNTAPPEVIKAYLNLEDENILRNLLEYRRKENIISFYHLFKLTGKSIPEEEGVNCFPSYIIELKIEAGKPKSLYKIAAGLDLRLKTFYPYEIIYWKEI